MKNTNPKAHLFSLLLILFAFCDITTARAQDSEPPPVLANVYVTSPMDGAINIRRKVAITSKAVTDATEYTIEISPNQDFSDSQVMVGGRMQTFNGLTYNTVYYARVKTNLNPSYGKVTTFKTIPAEALAYVTGPMNGAIDRNANLKITSHEVPGALNYTIQLSETQDFAVVAFEKTGTTRTLLFSGLKYSTLYYNRVKTNLSSLDDNPCLDVCMTTYNGCVAAAAGDPDVLAVCSSELTSCQAACPVGERIWGATRSFTTRSAESISYVLYPKNGSIDKDTKLNITANLVPGATSYTIQLSETEDFDVVNFEQTGQGRVLLFAGLNPGTTYFNRVTTNAPGAVGFGRIKSFTTKGVMISGLVLTSPSGRTGVSKETTTEANSKEITFGEFRVAVYPNPFKQKLSITITNPRQETAALTLTDMTGKVFHQSNRQTNTTVEIEETIPAGVYLLNVQTSGGRKIMKVIKTE